jgi:hypothetical protein
MLTINNLREFTTEIKAVVEKVNTVAVVVDDSQFVKLLSDISVNDNFMFIAVVPQYPLNGNDDQYKWNNQLQFFLLKKSTDRNNNLSNLLDNLNETQEVMNEIITIMLSEKIGADNQICKLSNELVPGSLMVQPVWEKAQCNGWVLELDLLTRV